MKSKVHDYKKIFVISIMLLISFIMFFNINRSHQMRQENSLFLEQNFSKNNKLTPEVGRENVLTQNVYVPKQIEDRNINIFVRLRNEKQIKDASIDFVLTQGYKKREYRIGSNMIGKDEFVKLKIERKEFDSGNIEMKIISNNKKTGIKATLTKDLYHGSEARINTINSGASLLIRISEEMEFNYLQMMLFLTVVLGIILILYRRDEVNIYFVLSITYCLYVISLRFPEFILYPQIYAEQGTNFIFNGIEKGYIENMKTLDYGYLPLLQRIISVFIIKVFGGINYFNYYSQYISIMFITFFVSYINIKPLRGFIEDDCIRFLISIAIISSPFISYAEFTFINFSYFGFLFSLLVIYRNKQELTRSRLLIMSIFSFLILSSKALYVIFLPLYVILMFYNASKKKYKEFIFYAVSNLSLIIQLFVSSGNKKSYMIMQRTLASLYNNLIIWLEVTLKSFGEYNISIWFILIFIVCKYIYIILKIYKNDNKKKYIFLLAIEYLVIMNILIGWVIYEFENIKYTRHFFMSNVGMKILNLTIIYSWLNEFGEHIVKRNEDLFKRFKLKQIIIVFFGAIVLSTIPINRNWKSYPQNVYVEYYGRYYTICENSHSNWSLYNKFISDEDYVIPINPYPWAILKNNEILVKFNEDRNYTKIDMEDVFEDSRNWSVRAITLDKRNSFSLKRKLLIKLYKGEKLISEIVEITNPENRYAYFKVEGERLKFDTMEVYYEDGSIADTISAKYIFYGIIDT